MALSQSVKAALQTARIAHLATVDSRGHPHIVPIVFVYFDHSLYSPIDRKPKTGAPTDLVRVRNILISPSVQVLLDGYAEDWERLWWVQIRGNAELLETDREYDRAVRLLEKKYPQYAQLPLKGRPLIRVRIGRVLTWGRLPS